MRDLLRRTHGVIWKILYMEMKNRSEKLRFHLLDGKHPGLRLNSVKYLSVFSLFETRLDIWPNETMEAETRSSNLINGKATRHVVVEAI